jgi:hypothetical protein
VNSAHHDKAVQTAEDAREIKLMPIRRRRKNAASLLLKPIANNLNPFNWFQAPCSHPIRYGAAAAFYTNQPGIPMVS